MKKREKSEAEIQRDIVEYLKTKKIRHTISNASSNTRNHRGSCLARGWPDITGCLKDGRFLGIECKSRTGVVSKEQQEQIDGFTEDGGLAFVARSLADAIGMIEQGEC